MKERLRLHSYGQSREAREVEVEYTAVAHYLSGENRKGGAWKAYDVAVDGRRVGSVHQVTESTDRHSGRIRIPGKGRLAWAWDSTEPIAGRRSNYPGLYRPSRRGAVAEMLGYGRAEVVVS